MHDSASVRAGSQEDRAEGLLPENLSVFLRSFCYRKCSMRPGSEGECAEMMTDVIEAFCLAYNDRRRRASRNGLSRAKFIESYGEGVNLDAGELKGYEENLRAIYVRSSGAAKATKSFLKCCTGFLKALVYATREVSERDQVTPEVLRKLLGLLGGSGALDALYDMATRTLDPPDRAERPVTSAVPAASVVHAPPESVDRADRHLGCAVLLLSKHMRDQTYEDVEIRANEEFKRFLDYMKHENSPLAEAIAVYARQLQRNLTENEQEALRLLRQKQSHIDRRGAELAVLHLCAILKRAEKISIFSESRTGSCCAALDSWEVAREFHYMLNSCLRYGALEYRAGGIFAGENASQAAASTLDPKT